MRAALAALAIIILATGFSLGVDVMSGDQPADVLAGIPLMTVVFAALVLFARRSVAAREEIRREYEQRRGAAAVRAPPAPARLPHRAHPAHHCPGPRGDSRAHHG